MILIHFRFFSNFFVEKGIIVELKAVKQLCNEHSAQLMNYLKATGLGVGYLINFGNPLELEWKRFVI